MNALAKSAPATPTPGPRPRSRPPSTTVASRAVRAALGFFVVAAAVGASRADAAEAPMRFEPIGVYQLEIDGKVVDQVRMFHSPKAEAVLVLTPSLPYPIAAVPRNKTIQRIDPAELADEPQGSVAWTPTGQQTAIATFDLVESKPVFSLEGKKIRFLDKPPLLGLRTREEIFAYDPSYPYRAATANPPTVYLDVINSWEQAVVVKMFFSTQCQVCRDLLPGVFKTIDRIKNPKIKFEFYGMPLPASKDPLGVELEIKDFPTGILYVDGKEIGRASGHSWRMPDMALHNALRGISIDPEALKVPRGTRPGP